ncbi:MAG: NAD(P)/FAD-dependent oxidoreductase [Chloroflexota bacterium]
MSSTADAVVIGAGIAGLSVGAELARERSVIVLEMEPEYASHTTARSATSWIAGYGRPAVKPFTLASRAWFEAGGGGHVERSLLERRGLMLVSTDRDAPKLSEAVANGASRLDENEAAALFPPLRTDLYPGVAHESDSHDIDVMTAVEAFRAALLRRGGELQTAAAVRAIKRGERTWQLETAAESVETATIVNAAGAWSDQIAELAGVHPLGLRVLRRTACTFTGPAGVDVMAWPLVMDAGERFYFKPDGGVVLASAADETPQPPGDARPAMEDVALALERVREATTLEPRTVRSSWAGLRTFATDRSLVLGPDPGAPGFAWYVGLGGFGIMSSPAASRSVVSLIDGGSLPSDVVAAGGEAAAVLPDRLRR